MSPQLQTVKVMDIHQSSTASSPESLTALFNDAEASFPPRFREHGWYLTMVSQRPKTLVDCIITIVIFDNSNFKKIIDVCRYVLTLSQVASLIGSGQQKLAGHLYKHLISQPQYQTPETRQALVKRLREAMVKCIILNGIPTVIEAVTAVSEQERPEDQDLSCSR